MQIAEDASGEARGPGYRQARPFAPLLIKV
jgi:hypothetical protein